MPSIEYEDIEEYMRAWVEARHDVANKGIWPKPDTHYICFEEYVLQHGRQFTEFSPRKYKLGQIKMCFDNAYMTTMRSRGALTYVEGFAYWSMMPVLHAWCMDSEGRIVDTTWHGRETMIDKPLAATNYYGVPFELEQIRDLRRRSGGVSLIDDWEHGWPLLRKEHDAGS